MGVRAAANNMPSAKFQFPTSDAALPVNSTFTIKLAVQQLFTRNFVSSNESYFAAPQKVDPTSGDIIGHAHVVIDSGTSR